MFKRIAIATLLIATPAAALEISRFDKRGASQSDYMRDRYVCLQESKSVGYRGAIGSYSFGNGPQIMGRSVGGTYYSRGLFVSCMSARGYTLSERGRFAPPDGTVVRMGP